MIKYRYRVHALDDRSAFVVKRRLIPFGGWKILPEFGRFKRSGDAREAIRQHCYGDLK